MTESLSGQSALMAEIASDGVHDIVLFILEFRLRFIPDFLQLLADSGNSS
jgi:hypothetical protein